MLDYAKTLKSMDSKKQWRIFGLTAAIIGISLLHYLTPTHHFWLHELFQRGYYIPILLAALWFGWRGGVLSAAFAGLLYAPHIILDWSSFPGYSAHHIEVLMFFGVGIMCGVLADQARKEHTKLEETARRLNVVNQQLQASFEHLRRADRLSALGELSAGLAHEIRNPLGAIEGAVQILRRPELPVPTRQEFGEVVQKEVNRLKDLLSNFLEFARPRPPQRVPTNPDTLLESVKSLAQETAKMSGIHISVESSSSLPLVGADPEQMRQVLLNLVINALQAMPNGGQVVLRAGRRSEHVILQVQDEGGGIDAENLERIFDPFFTTRPEGTGLGLSTAYQIVSQHGGHISVQRNTGKGMTFTVTLPLREPEDPLDPQFFGSVTG